MLNVYIKSCMGYITAFLLQLDFSRRLMILEQQETYQVFHC